MNPSESVTAHEAIRQVAATSPPPRSTLCNRGAGLWSALAANALWASAVVAPLVFPNGSPVLLAAGRYLALGIASIVLAAILGVARIGRSGWAMALILGLTGNVAYFVLLSAAVQLSNGPPAIIILATLPVVVALAGNIHHRAVAWKTLAVPLSLAVFGLVVVNAQTLASVSEQSASQVAWGIALAVAAVALWTTYAVLNSAYLRSRPDVSATQWSTIVGIAALPPALALLPAGLGTGSSQTHNWAALLAVSLFLGIAVSWGGTALWNRAVAQLPDALAGQLIITESIFAMALAAIITGFLPTWPQLVGYSICALGIVLTIRTVQRPRA